MTRDISPDLRYLRLYFTRPHKCSYLPERQAVTSFVDPGTVITTSLYSQLSRLGFRRSGKFLYAPNCDNCQACVVCRIVVPKFEYTRAFRRCLNKSNDLQKTFTATIDIEEHYQLFESYINARHRDGDMYPPNLEQYLDFLGEGSEYTRYLEFRRNGDLVGCSVVDILDDGLSAIYTYFSPDTEHRSPGTLAILCLVNQAADIALPYVYLGYWIDECRKMSYKGRFHPQELFLGNRWVTNERDKSR